jgi:4-amino-4-deoxy-L-arabinose transferase-like glycosyltransferase
MLKKHLTLILLTVISLISLFINIYKQNLNCLTTDEAAFGYNAYSILKTGKDEYGSLLPLRFKSFGDYKMPLYSYLSVPFIAIGGLNETTTRSLNTVIAITFPFIMYLLTYQLFKNKYISLLASFLLALSPGLQTIGRQAHESYVTTFFLATTILLFLKFIEKNSVKFFSFFTLSLFIFSLGYQFSRLWIVFFAGGCLFVVVKKLISKKFILPLIVAFIILFVPDIIARPARVGNLLFFNNIGLGLQTTELRNEGGGRVLYNKATVGIKNLILKHISYFSPQFLVIRGDENYRFGHEGISPISLIEYLFVYIGLYYLFKEKQKFRYILLILLLFAPLAGSLTWTGFSITRTLPLIVILSIISAYGFFGLVKETKNSKAFLFILLPCLFGYGILMFYSWDFYFNHYPKRALTIRAFECGNKEMAEYVKTNYSLTDKFYITKKNGQPYIYLLFYLNYPPEKYQQIAKLSAPDRFGFGQVEGFDKFIFSVNSNIQTKKTVLIGYPDDFTLQENSSLKKIKVGTETIFLIKQIK